MPASARRLVLFVTAAGGERARRAAEAAAGPAGWAGVRVVSVRGPADAVAALRAMEPEETPVAAGGDGTVNLLGRALVEADLGARPFGILPLGTGNAFAHGLGLGRREVALAALASGTVRPLDCMLTSHAEAPVVLASLSVGLESRFIHRSAGPRVAGDGMRLVRGALVSGVVRGRVSGVLLELDGRAVVRPEERLYNAGLYNTTTYSWGAPVFPSAVHDDGVGEALIRGGPGSYWRTLAFGARGVLAPLPWRSAVLETAEPVQLDGEPGPAGRFEVRMARGALRVLVPSSGGSAQ